MLCPAAPSVESVENSEFLPALWVYGEETTRLCKGVIKLTSGLTNESNSMPLLFDRFAFRTDSISVTEYSVLFERLRTYYEIDKITSEREYYHKKSLMILWSSIILMLFMLAILFYNHLIIKKSRLLLYKKRRGIENRNRKSSKETEHTTKKTDAEMFLGSAQQHDLINRLSRYLLDGHKLSDIDVNRSNLVSILGTNKNSLSEAARVVTGKTLMSYIRHLQLEEAGRMLESHPELTIEAIMVECGFNAPNTFYRQFRKHYGVSPARYRQMAASNKAKVAKP